MLKIVNFLVVYLELTIFVIIHFNSTNKCIKLMEVKIKKLNESAVVPSYAKPGDAGLDLTAISYECNDNGHVYGTGLAIEIPQGYVGLIFPRSSNRKTQAYLTNSVGVIDSGYRGEIMVTFKNRDVNFDNQEFAPYKLGERVAQLIIVAYPAVQLVEVTELSESERGTGGHGSTGK